MAEPWMVTLLAGSVLVLVGFLASQAFERFRLPDYILLIGVGIALGHNVLPLGEWDPTSALTGAAPLLLKVAIAFILFEGGLALNLRRIGRAWGLAAGHAITAMAITIGGVWLVGRHVLGLEPTTALILGIAMCAPSETIVLSFLPRLNVRESTKFALTLEGVLGNLVATALVLAVARPGGLPSGQDFAPFLLDAVFAFGIAALVGLAWDRMVGAAKRPAFLYITSVAIAVLLYAIGEGVFRGNGGLSAFAFGLVLGHWGPPEMRRDLVGETPGSRYLQQFHRELVFLFRTFFFVFLGLRINLSTLAWPAIVGAAVLVIVFAATRWPTTSVLARAWHLPRVDVRVLRAVVARGLTDTVLILYAISVGVIGSLEATTVTNLLFVVIVLAATVSAILVMRAERLRMAPPVPDVAPRPATPASTPSPPPARPLPPPPEDEPLPAPDHAAYPGRPPAP